MLKEPHPGRVKTRLGRDIGVINATWWFRHQTRGLIQRLGYDSRWQTVLCVSPDSEGLNSRIWPNLPRWAQGTGDLGARMGRILRHGPKGTKLIIGADIPDITSQHIADGFKALARNTAVIGPAPDGGYWAIGWNGVRTTPPQLFQGVRWSSSHARDDTLASLGTKRVGILPSLRDVDQGVDLI